MSLAAWYQSQYANSPLVRTARTRMMPFVAPPERGIPQALQRLGTPQQPGQPIPVTNGEQGMRKEGEEPKEKKNATLFGPPVGNVGAEERAKWGVLGGEADKEELPPEVLKKWIGKSSESSVPTTTLQALTNLKRTTLRLHPLHTAHTPSSTPPPPDPFAPHGLEFAYDADCPFVRITVRVLPPTNYAVPEQVQAPGIGEEVYSAVLKGGFGQVLGPEANVVVELGRYEQFSVIAPPPAEDLQLVQRVPSASGEGTPSGPQTNIHSPTPGRGERERRRFSFLALRSHHRHSVAFPSPGPALATVPTRTRGPALPVVDALAAPTPAAPPAATGDMAPNPPISPALAAQLGFHVVDAAERAREEIRERERREEEGSGVRVGIWVEALGEDGKELPMRNAQATFLHVHRVGMRPRPPTPPPSSAAIAGGEGGESSSAVTDLDLESGIARVHSRATTAAVSAPAEQQQPVVDNRPWLVKVVHREAIIGKRTFTLHEIYGLASSSVSDPVPPHPSSDPSPPLPSPNPHSYPPHPAAVAAAAEGDDHQHTAPECILCLSSPRSVVLMPCRHLVACKECALNMLEFGAGGSIYHPPEEGADAAGAGAAGGVAGAQGAGVGVIGGPGIAIAPPTRRKRKVKGWFCPICRQPYTSMLRISLVSPEGELVAEIDDNSQEPSSPSGDAHEHGVDLEADPLGGPTMGGARASTSSVPKGWKAHQEVVEGEGAEGAGDVAGVSDEVEAEAPPVA